MATHNEIVNFIYALASKIVKDPASAHHVTFENAIFWLDLRHTINGSFFAFTFKPSQFRILGQKSGQTNWEIQQDGEAQNLFEIYGRCLLSLV